MSDKLIEAVVDFLSKNIQNESGPFSYGAKKPRRGSVADLADKKRREQQKNQQPIEPKDQMVGTAKVTKVGVREDSELEEVELEEGILSTLMKVSGTTPKDVANSTISALNKKAPGTKMHNHPNFSKFKQDVHDHISSAKDAGEAIKRSSDKHVMSLVKKHFTEEVEIELEEDFSKMNDHELKQWITTRQMNAMGGNLSKKRKDQYDQAQAELKKRSK